MNSKLYIPANSAAAPFTVAITAEDAGWAESSLHVLDLGDGGEVSLATEGTEVMILPLAGAATVECAGETFALSPRVSVFDGPADMVYLGIGQEYTLSGRGRIAICGARASASFPNRRVAAADVPVELRGAGNCSREVHNFGTATTFEADSLIACEVLTPGGNWSSYPPHKHEHDRDGEAELEETYYYRLRDPENGWAVQRVYSPERDFDLTQTVRDGELLLIPWGYHTTVAAHGHDLYYLNVLAGPAPKRTLQAFQDPCLKSTQDAWPDAGMDSRLPFVPRHPNA
jgi:5-deoxy-glucuronate isomerase